jgi:hypothetical protein
VRPNWQSILTGLGATVEYEDASFGVAVPASDADLALFDFPGDRHIEVSWDDEDRRYVVSLYELGFHSLLDQRRIESIDDTISAVRELAERVALLRKTGRETVSRTSRDTRRFEINFFDISGIGELVNSSPSMVTTHA